MMHENFDQWSNIKKSLNAAHQPPFFNEREIWWCSVGMNIGFEVYGKGHLYARPVLIMRKLSKFSFFGIPLTSQRKENPYYYPINFAGVEGAALLGQIRVMDNKRLSKIMGTLGKKQFEELRHAIKELL